MRRHHRVVATVLALVGLVAVAGSVDVTRASWNDNSYFSAAVSSGQWGTTTTTTTPTTTTTVPPPPPPPPGDPNGGITAGNPDTVIDGIVWTINGSRQFCTEVLVTGASATPRPWRIDIDLTQAPFSGVSPNQVNTTGTGRVTTIDAQHVFITGNSNNGPWNPQWNNSPITNAQTARLTICLYNAPVPPPADPSTYTVTYAVGPWTDTQACVTATVTTTRHDLATFPFYYGWSVPLDLTAAKARITSVGNTLNFVSWNPYPNGDTDGRATPASYNPPLDSYTFTSGFNTAIRAAGGGADSKSVTACVNGYSTGNNGNGNGKGKNSNVAATPTEESTPTAGRTAETTSTVAAATVSSTTLPPTSAPSTTLPAPTSTSSTLPGSTSTSTLVPSTTTTAVPTTLPPPTPSSSAAPSTTTVPASPTVP